ncbi:hypothetical protein Tco_0326808 [Tanacetum coccineum]
MENCDPIGTPMVTKHKLDLDTNRTLVDIMQDVRTPAEAFNSGGIQFLGEKLVICSSKRQDCIVLSTAKAECVSLFACCAQVLWMRT